MKKLFAIVMSVLMIACFMPSAAFASGGQTTPVITISDEPQVNIATALYGYDADESSKISSFTANDNTMKSFDVTLKSTEAVTPKCRIEVTDATEGLQLIAVDSQNAAWDIVKPGWGPAKGFEISKGYDVTTRIYAFAVAEGDYSATVRVVTVPESKEKDTEPEVLASATFEGTASYQAKIGEISYNTLYEAISAVPEHKKGQSETTIELLSDVQAEKCDCGGSNQTKDGFDVNNKKIIIEGKGHKMTLAHTAFNHFEDSNAEGLLKGSLEVKNVNFEATLEGNNGYAACLGFDSSFDISLDGCTFKNMYTGVYANPRKTAADEALLEKITITNCKYENTTWGYSIDDVTGGALSYWEQASVTFENNTGLAPGHEMEVFGGTVAEVGKQRYATLPAAIGAAEGGETVKLLQDVDEPDAVEIGAEKDITIDLNGKKIKRKVTSSTSNKFTLKVAGNLTLKDSSESQTGAVAISGNETSSESETQKIAVFVVKGGTFALASGTITAEANSGQAVGVKTGGTFTMESGTIDVDTTNGAPAEDAQNDAYGVAIMGISGNDYDAKASFTVKGGTVKANTASSNMDAYGVSILGSAKEATSNDTKFTMEGGKIESSGHGVSSDSSAGGTKIEVSGGEIEAAVLAIYHPQKGELAISGGSLTGNSGIEMKAGTATISDKAVIKATGKANVAHNTDGNDTNGYAVAAVGNVSDDYVGAPSVTITGGTFTGKVAAENENYVNKNKKGKIEITGGTYSEDPSECVADQYMSVKGEGTWTVQAYSAKVANVTVAPLADHAEENAIESKVLEEGYSIAYDEQDASNVTISVHPQYHTSLNGTSPVGKWIGVAVPLPEYEGKSIELTYEKYKDTAASSKTATIEGADFVGEDGTKYVSIYWDYAEEDINKIDYQFEGGPKQTLTVAVNATPVSVDKAPLSDESEEYTSAVLDSRVKTIEYKDGVATINHTKLLVHKMDGSFGKWVGFTVPADYVAESVNQTYLYYKVDNNEWTSVALKDVLDESKKNVCFYFDADKVGEDGITYEYAFGTSESVQGAAPIGVNTLKVLLKGTEECSEGNHTFGDWTTVTEATCAAEGEKSHTCKKCDYVETQKTPKIAHTYEKEGDQQGEEAKDKVEVLTAPTCEETGTGIKTCTVCNHTEKVTIAATGHSEVVDAAEEATCTKTGLTEGKHCSVCNKVLTAQNEIAKKSHTLTKTDAKAATCTTAGNCEYWTCNVCNGIFSDETCKTEIAEGEQTIAALGHTMTETEAKEVTCTQDGNNAYWTCKTCKKVFSDEEGQTETNVEAQTHKATGHKLTHAAAKEATSSAEGNYEYWYCDKCEKYFKDSEAETEYEKDAWRIAKKSSSTSGGGGGGYVAPSNTTNTNGTTTTTTKPSTTTVGGVTTTSATLSTSDAASLIAGAATIKSTNVVINAATGTAVKEAESGTKTEITIPADAVSQIVEKTDASVTIKSDVASVTLDKAAVEALAAKAGTAGNVKLIVNTVAQDENKVQIELKLETANGEVSDFGGGNVSVTVKLGAALAAKDVVCVYIEENGVYQKVTGTKNADGTFTFTTLHFSSYAVMPAEDAEKVIEEQAEKAAELTSALSLKASSEKTAKGGVKVTLTVDEDSIKAIEDLGYTVKYKFYRSTKKAASYQAKYEKASKTYTNTKGTKGTKYYYKARVMVYDQEGTLVAKSALKQCKYACRTFSK